MSQRIKERIKKLLATVCDAGATEGEVENAMLAAQNLMAQYQIDQADLEQQEMGELKSSTHYTNMTTWEAALSSWVSQFTGAFVYCTSVTSLKKGRVRTGRGFAWAGTPDDIDLAKSIFEDLQTTIVTLAMARYRTAYSGDGGVYCQGFVRGLFDQTTKAIETQRITSNALVVQSQALVVQKVRETKQWLTKEKNMTFRAGTKRRGARGSSGAFETGRQDGQNCDLNFKKDLRLEVR